MHAKRLVLSTVVLATLTGAVLLAKVGDEPDSGTAMADAATKFLETLTPEQRKQATYSFDDKERLNWHFIPRPRKGLPLKSLEGAPLKAAHALIQSGLSPAGYDQTINIMSLEEILFLLEGGEREYRRDRRDPQKYYLTVFGTPGKTGTWGWRLEGHHISLNYTIKDGKVVSSTPEFFGANPGLVDAGPKRAVRVLGTEEDLARQILKLCTPEQQTACWINKTAPGEVHGTMGGPPDGKACATQPEKLPQEGLQVAKMSADQKELMKQLLSEYLRNMPADVEKERRAKLNAAGVDNIYFAWWGSSERNEPHHYAIQGPTFQIEYNNTQNDANHVHSYWRNLEGDFNIPAK